MKYQVIKGTRHYVYDHISDFYNDHPDQTPVKDWREGKEGDWVWSDDDNIVQLIKVSNVINHPGDRKNYKYAKGWVRTVVGTFLNRPNTIMDTDFEKHKNRYTFSGKIKSPSTRIKERKNLTKRERIFATSVVAGRSVLKAYKEAFSSLASDKDTQKKAVVLLKQERVMKEIERGVMDVAKSMGIDHEYILHNLKCLCENSDDENIILQSTKELGKVIGTLGTTTIRQQEVGVLGMLQEFSPEQLAAVKRPELEVSTSDSEES
jgi:hypothetical protein|tara:strand:+ start:526 stop:1314 length:789 start_codon:yes stop_codon:yes gene_type:complete